MSTMIEDHVGAASRTTGTSTVRLRSSVTSLSWIPSHGVPGAIAVPSEGGALHDDRPPPKHLAVGDLPRLHRDGRFRVANELSAWIDVDIDQDGVRHIVGYGHDGQGWISSTTVSIAGVPISVEPVRLPDLRPEPEVGDGWVRFTQTTGGRPGLLAPRRLATAPYVAWKAPVVWTTLELTLHADGRSERRLVTASPFPRHWIYDGDGALMAKTGWLRFRYWYHQAVQQRSPWGDPAGTGGAGTGGSPLVAEPPPAAAVERPAERAIEHLASGSAMLQRHDTARLRPGQELRSQGEGEGEGEGEGDGAGGEVYLVLDGIVRIEVDGREVGDVGPGTVVGERAARGDGRTATLRAVTPVQVVAVTADRAGFEALSSIAMHHRGERDA